MEKDIINWKDIPVQLKNYFLLRWLLSTVIIIGMVITAVTTGLYKIFLFLAMCGLLYGIYIFYLLQKTRHSEMLMYEGICESIKKDSLQIPKPWPFKAPLATIYGKSQLTIRINDEKYIVPIPQNFKVEEGNSIQIYTLNSDIYEIGENAYIINNPVLVWISKI